MGNLLQKIISLFPANSISISSDGTSLSLPQGGINLSQLGNDALQILPDGLAAPINNAFNNLGGSVLKLQHAFLMEASISNQTIPAATNGTEGGNSVNTSVETFSIHIQWNSASWELIHNFLSLENPELKAYLTTTTVGSTVTTNTAIYLSGTLQIGGIPLPVSVTLPDMLVSGSLPAANNSSGTAESSKTYPVSNLFSAFGFNEPVFQNIALNQFTFSASLISRIFNIEIGISSDLTFIINNSNHITITQCGAKLIHIGGTPSSNSISVWGQCEINAQVYSIWISYDSETGWSFSGEGNFNPGLPLLDTANSIIKHFGLTGDITLPESFSNTLNIHELSFTYTSATNGFDFKVVFDQPLSVAALTGNEINPKTSNTGNSTDSVNATCTFAEIKTARINNARSTFLEFKLEAGMPLIDFLDLQEDLSTGFNPVLDEVDFKMDLSSQASRYSFSTSFSNSPTPNDMVVFDGEFSSITHTDNSISKWFGGSMYSPSGNAINLNDPSFPIDMAIHDLFIAKISETDAQKKETTFTLFGVDMSAHAGVNLSAIPVVGDFFTEAHFSFDAIRLVYAKCSDRNRSSIESELLKTINSYLDILHIAPLQIAQNTATNNSSSDAPFPLGFSLQGNLIVGDKGTSIPLYSLIQQNGQTTGPSTTQITPAAPSNSENTQTAPRAITSSNATPSPVQKKYGPLSIQAVSLGMSAGELCLTFTGGLQLGILFVDFIGLEFSTPLSSFSPSVSLNGLGFDLSKPPLLVEGMFLKGQVEVPIGMANGVMQTTSISSYSGELSVVFGEYGLVAMGSYAKLPSGDPSIFIYGFLGAPLGGLPVILMITGVAAGFGYNRKFSLPEITSISSYPLIQPVIPGNSGPTDFNALNLNFMPTKGAFWGAIGIRVESFKMVETFLLLSVKFNTELEIDVIGLANMKFPGPLDIDPATTPQMANIIVGVEARIIPSRGIIAVNGAFQDGSYVYCPEAHITGGFAMLSVLKEQRSGEWQGANEGDFVFTLGGYAPDFHTPDYYPSISRLELNWQVSSALRVNAQFYFATTPIAMMAGGSIHGLFKEGGDFSIAISFLLGADFIMYWHPYHYTAHFYADLHVTASVNLDLWLFTIHFSVDMDLNADLHIWGPEFSGYGTVSVHVLITFSASVSFGANQNTPPLLSWGDFLNNCLPAPDKILTINLSSGLIASQSTAEDKANDISAVYVVNPKDLALVCGTAFPVMKFANSSVNTPENGAPTFSFGIQPMGKASHAIEQSDFTLRIHHVTPGINGNPDVKVDKTNDFILTAITKNMPSALWNPIGNSGELNLNGDSTVKNLVAGISIVPQTPISGNSCTISLPKYDVAATFAASFADSTFTYTSIKN